MQFNGIDRDSGDDGGYADHTDSISDPVEPGESYELSVTMSTGGYSDYVTVVVDWSQDYDLSNEEVIEVGGGDDDPMTVTTDITVPEDAEAGETRMRVMQSYNEYHKQPCENQEYGETEDYTVKIASIEPHLEADFSYEPESPEEGETIQFTDESTSTGGEIVEWSWDFGDGETSPEQYPTHVYDEKGDYTVELNVAADNELSDETTKDITVEEKIVIGPEAEFSFTPEDPEEDEEVKFTDDSIEGDSEIVEWSWDFGDGETSPEQHPTHSFNEEDEYTVELTVTDSEEISDTTTQEIQVVSESEYYTATNSEHEEEGRAYSEFDWGEWGFVYYAEGSDDELGSGSEETTLKRVDEGHYKLVDGELNAEEEEDVEYLVQTISCEQVVEEGKNQGTTTGSIYIEPVGRIESMTTLEVLQKERYSER